MLDFMRDWNMEAPASFEPLPPSTWTSRASKHHEIDFVLIPSARHDLVQWNAAIPRVALALRGQEDHRLVATQVALQPKPTVAVTPSIFYSRDALWDPETARQIQQFYDSVPAIPPERDATTAVELFSKVALLGLVGAGSRSRHGPFFSSSLRQDARVSPPYDNAAAAFSA